MLNRTVTLLQAGFHGHIAGMLIQPTVNVALRSKLLSIFFRPAHTWRQYTNSFGRKTLMCAPSSGGKLPNYSGRRTSQQPPAWGFSMVIISNAEEEDIAGIICCPVTLQEMNNARAIFHWLLTSKWFVKKCINKTKTEKLEREGDDCSVCVTLGSKTRTYIQNHRLGTVTRLGSAHDRPFTCFPHNQ